MAAQAFLFGRMGSRCRTGGRRHADRKCASELCEFQGIYLECTSAISVTKEYTPIDTANDDAGMQLMRERKRLEAQGNGEGGRGEGAEAGDA